MKATIPENENIRADIDNNGSLFDRRIAAVSNYTYDQENKTFRASEELCKYFGTKQKTYLGDEVGIKELENLYIDEFDYLNGKFVSMSKTNREEYDKDILQFYKAFTDNNYRLTNPDILREIRSITNVKINNYDIEKNCGENGLYRSSFKNIRLPVATEIKKRIKLMEDHNEDFKKQLIAILTNVFIIDKSVTPFTITLNPKLNEDMLDKLIAKTREIIINMYITCETDFSNVLKLFNEELIDKSTRQDGVDPKKRVYVKSDDEAHLVLNISEPVSIAQPLKEKINNLGENMVDTEKELKDSLDANITKPLGELQDEASRLVMTAKDKTLEGVKAIPIQIGELAQNKVLEAQERLAAVADAAKEQLAAVTDVGKEQLADVANVGKEQLADVANVANVAKEKAGNLVTGLQNRFQQLFATANVGGKKSKRHRRPLKNRRTKSKNK